MIIARLTGGLGNQLFQYALGRTLAVRNGSELLVDVSGYGAVGEARPEQLRTFPRPVKLFEFEVQARVATAEDIASLRDTYSTTKWRHRLVRQARRLAPGFMWKKTHFVERTYKFDARVLELSDGVYLEGFWQSPKYFESIAPVIRRELKLRNSVLVESAREHVSRLKKRHGHVVSLHIRRGDLAFAQQHQTGKQLVHAAPVGLDYINAAMDQFDEDACFFVFSDSPQDINWCKSNIHASNVEFTSARSDLWDFAAMQACDDHIIANSTFSWWAAWLDDNTETTVIAPREWSFPEARFRIVTDDLIPSRWRLLP